MRIKWDKEVCNSYGTCAEEAPEIFSLSPEGRLVIATESPDPELYDKVRDACSLCPTGALQLVEQGDPRDG